MPRVQCPICRKTYTTLLEIPEGDTRPIQQIFPHEPAWKREQLLTGICSDECWDECFNMRPRWREEDDFDCPEPHLNYKGCIIPNPIDDAIICPYYDRCEDSGQTRWIYTPLK